MLCSVIVLKQALLIMQFVELNTAEITATEGKGWITSVGEGTRERSSSAREMMMERMMENSVVTAQADNDH